MNFDWNPFWNWGKTNQPQRPPGVSEEAWQITQALMRKQRAQRPGPMPPPRKSTNDPDRW
jgi:hypothetical protein